MFKDHFEQAFCINLDKRPDRWKKSLKQFEKIGIEVERVEGVDGFELPRASIRPGEVGCLKSHLKVFEIAKERNLESFLLLEDDVEFADDFHERFADVEKELKSYEMLYCGYNMVSGQKQEFSKNLVRLQYVYAAHCVIFKKSCYDDIITALNGPLLYPVDTVYGMHQTTHSAYGIKPAIAWQRKDFSDINQEIVDYHFIRGYN